MPELAPESLSWKGVRFLDPVGRVFDHDGETYRAIYPAAAEQVQALFDHGTVDRLVEKRLLVETTVSSLQVAGYAMVLHHRRVPFLTRASQWPRSLLRDAARLVVDLNLELAKDGLGTVDYHANNVQQVEACRPIWIDFGSIQPLAGPSTAASPPLGPRRRLTQIRRAVRARVAQRRLIEEIRRHLFLNRAGIASVNEEFRRNFLYPLALLARDAEWGRTVRLLLDAGGISDGEYRLLGGKASFPRLGKSRQAWLESTQDWLDKLELPTESSAWGRYHQTNSVHAAGERLDPRTEIVARIVRDRQPKRVIDLGCNAGAFSALVARTVPGAEIYAVDSDEPALAALHAGAPEWTERAQVTVGLGDVLALSVEPSPIQGQFALALALTHHLFFAQRCQFPVIAKLLASFTTDELLTEFMPNGLGGTTPKPIPLPATYTLERFIASLEGHFRKVEVIRWSVPHGTSPRLFVHARGKR